MQGSDQMIFRNGSLFKELLHEFILTFGNQFDQSFVGCFCRLLQTGRNGSFFPLAITTKRVRVGFHRDQIHHAGKILFAADRELYRHNLTSEGIAE